MDEKSQVQKQNKRMGSETKQWKPNRTYYYVQKQNKHNTSKKISISYDLGQIRRRRYSINFICFKGYQNK
jgi:hypothetical protein